MNILVTGGAGGIGSTLCMLLSKIGHEPKIIILSGSTPLSEETLNACKNYKLCPTITGLLCLKKIAKKLSIPITFKDGVTRKQLKKDELYEKIKTHLIQKNNSL